MAEERGDKGRRERDATSEITVGDLEAVEPPSTELALDELMEELDEPPKKPTIPPAPGKGLPRRPEAKGPTSTERNAIPPAPTGAKKAARAPADDAPTTKAARVRSASA